jgi:hypothetical protein
MENVLHISNGKYKTNMKHGCSKCNELLQHRKVTKESKISSTQHFYLITCCNMESYENKFELNRQEHAFQLRCLSKSQIYRKGLTRERSYLSPKEEEEEAQL